MDTTTPTTTDVPTVESLKGRDLLSLADLSKEEFAGLLQSAHIIKNNFKRGEKPLYLQGKTIAMIFEKQSLRTRSTFDIAMYQLGGHSVLLSQNYIGWGVRETIKDVAHNLERWVEGIMARTYGHGTLVELARHAHVPIINGLSDLVHPCQLTADYLTLKEEFGELQRASRSASSGTATTSPTRTFTRRCTREPHSRLCARKGSTRTSAFWRKRRRAARTSQWHVTRGKPPEVRMSSIPTCGFRWAKRRRPSGADKPSRATR